MRVGVVRETKTAEGRVALTPAGARELSSRGHAVLVERGAGARAGFADNAYRVAGAALVDREAVWAESELLLKVKEPLERRVSPPAPRPDALHLPAPRRRAGPGRGSAARSGVDRDRLRDGRGGRRDAAAAGADERDRRPPRDPGGRLLHAGPGRRRRPPDRRRPRRRPGAGAGDRWRRRRHQRRPGSRRHGRRRDDPRPLAAAHPSARGVLRRPRPGADVRPADAGRGSRRGRPGDRGRTRPRRTARRT